MCNAGDALTVPAGVVHAARNAGSGNAAELATDVVEKGSRSSRWPVSIAGTADGWSGVFGT